jgi:hypothetical protein
VQTPLGVDQPLGVVLLDRLATHGSDSFAKVGGAWFINKIVSSGLAAP